MICVHTVLVICIFSEVLMESLCEPKLLCALMSNDCAVINNTRQYTNFTPSNVVHYPVCCLGSIVTTLCIKIEVNGT